MKRHIMHGGKIVDSEYKSEENEAKKKWSLMEKLLLGLTPRQYLAQAIRNPFNWILAAIFAIGIPLILGRFVFGLHWITHSSNDYPWGLILAFGLFTMVPLSASGFMLGTAVEIFGRHDFHPIERLALLNGLLGYFFAVIFLMVDLGQPWRLPYPMVVSFGTAAVLFLVAWHVATYLSVQIAEVSVSFFEWIGWPQGAKFIRKIIVGLTVAGIILSTLHQGALGALFTYAHGKLHPLWYYASFQWIYFFCSAIPAGLCMVIAVSTIVKKTMAWRCDDNFMDNLDSLTLKLAKGASLGLITYLAIKMIGVAHYNLWGYLATGWGQWYLLEMFVGVVLPIALFGYALRHNKAGLARFTAFLTIFGVALNRINTSLIAYNYKIYHEIPHWREVIVTLTIFAIYIVVYRFILYRLPILYTWKTAPQTAEETVEEPVYIHSGAEPRPVSMYREMK